MSIEYPVFIDFEASSLEPGSYPVEVAWSDCHGEIESHLINPYAIDDWTDWDPCAQDVHGLSRSYLSQHGKHPFTVAKRMNKMLADKIVYCDGGEFDKNWCYTLFSAVGLTSKFELYDVQKIWHDELSDEYLLRDRLCQNNLADIKNQARIQCGLPAHRAGNDVAYLVELWRIIQELK